MPACPDCGGVMIAGEEYTTVIKRGHGRRTLRKQMISLECISCGSSVGTPKETSNEFALSKVS